MRFSSLRCGPSDSLLHRSNKLSRADLVESNARAFVLRRQKAQRAESRDIAAYERRQAGLMVCMDDSTIVARRRSEPSQRFSMSATWHSWNDGSRRTSRQRDLQIKREWSIENTIKGKDRSAISKLKENGVKVNEFLLSMSRAWQNCEESDFLSHANGLMLAMEDSLSAFTHLKMRQGQHFIRPRLPATIQIDWNWSLFQELHELQYLCWERVGKISECGLIVVGEMEVLAASAGIGLPGLQKKYCVVFQQMLEHLQGSARESASITSRYNDHDDLSMDDPNVEVVTSFDPSQDQDDDMDMDIESSLPPSSVDATSSRATNKSSSQGNDDDDMDIYSSLPRSSVDMSTAHATNSASAKTSIANTRFRLPTSGPLTTPFQSRNMQNPEPATVPISALPRIKANILSMGGVTSPATLSTVRSWTSTISSAPVTRRPLASSPVSQPSQIPKALPGPSQKRSSSSECENRLLALFSNIKFKLDLKVSVDRIADNIAKKKPFISSDVALITHSCNWISGNFQGDWFVLETVIAKVDVNAWWQQVAMLLPVLRELKPDFPMIENAEMLRDAIQRTEAIWKGEAAKAASKEEIVKGVGAFDSSRIGNQKNLLSFFANPRFKTLVYRTMQSIIKKLNSCEIVTARDTEILIRSSTWLVHNRNQKWFDRDEIVLDDDVGEYKANIVSFLCQVQGRRKRFTSRELDLMQGRLEKATMVFEGKILSQHKLGSPINSYDSIPSGDPSLFG